MAKAGEQKTSASGHRLLTAVLAIFALLVVAAIAIEVGTGLVTLPGGSPVAPGEIRTFADSGKPVETIDGKPVVRLFSTTWCPHCKWISSTYEKVVNEYVAEGKIIAYHWELDLEDNALTAQPENGIPDSELAVYSTFNPRGTIPTFVFGGRFYRVGNGYEMENDLVAEEAEFRAVIEALLKEAWQ